MGFFNKKKIYTFHDGINSIKTAGFFKNYIKNKELFLIFIPAIVYYCIFSYGPLYGIQIAFKNFIAIKGITGSEWVGLLHFDKMIHFATFWQVVRNTVILSLYNLIIGFWPPIILAILLNEMRISFLKKSVQTLTYLPHFLSWVVLAGIFIPFLSPSTGPINLLLKSIDIRPIYFLGDPRWFRTSLVMTSIWQGLGWGSIIYLAALSGVDVELYEAAHIDGAGRFKRIYHISLPSMTPVITIMLILSLRGILSSNFDQIFNLYNPAVYSVGDVLSTYVYRKGLLDMDYSFATAIGLFQNVIALVLVVCVNAIAKKINDYGIW